MAQVKEAISLNHAPPLKDKRAVVFGAAGSIGAAVAKEFAAQGAEVFLSGRTESSVKEVTKQITASGGRAHAAVVDADNDAAVEKYLDSIGRIDIVYNAVGLRATEYGNGKHAVDLTPDEFMVSLTKVVRPMFVTARAAARRMVKQRSGVIIFVTGSPARGHVDGATAIGAAFGAIETFNENLALELGPAGVRSVCVRTVANIDSRAIQGTIDFIVGANKDVTKEQIIAKVDAERCRDRAAHGRG